MTIKFYSSLKQKRDLKFQAHSKGQSTIHDDFISDNHNEGKLTFGIKPNPPERVIKSLDELNLLLFKKEIEYEDLLDLLTIQALMEDNKRWNRFKARLGL